MKTGLVLEGGAMRGMFTCGIIDTFMENNIEFDGAVGVSAGACFGCNIKSKQIGRAIRYNKKYCGDRRYSSFSNWIFKGDIFDPKFCYETLPFELDIWDNETFENNPMEFYTVSTDANTGKAHYHKCTDGMSEDILWMRASASMPIVSKLVDIDGGKYIDGGVADSIPIHFLEQAGYDRIVVVLTQPEDYVKKPDIMVKLAKYVLRKYPNLVKACENRHIVYNETLKYIKEKEKNGEILVLRPPAPLNISHITKNPAELERVYQIGRSVGAGELMKVRDFINE